MSKIKAGIGGAKVSYKIRNYLGVLMDDGDISTLEYSVYDLTNSQVVTTRQDVGMTTAEGVISLSVAETSLNGLTNKELRRVCLWVNDTEYWDPIIFSVVASGCAA